MDQMFAPLRKYADFYGRAMRTEYWLFFLFRVLLLVGFCVAFFAVAAATGGTTADDEVSGPLQVFVWLGVIGYLGLLLPELTVTVRRLHDQDLSGWLVLIGIVPMGGFVLFIFMLLKGTNGTNRHGPDPRAPADDAARVFA